uniref:Neurotransmitter-gated ion-channel ligand-binding domain-containing protein n=1 Tax=Acrobeloides nanus TaxID=290746 RepID=A0A914CMY8_9BILA
MACLYMVIAVRNHDFSDLRRHRSQRYRVHFFKSPNGKYISFINLRATFIDPEAVDVEPEKTKYNFYDFDDSTDDEDQTIIIVTPMPLLETLVTPIPPSIQVIYTESTKPVPMVSEIASTSTTPTTSKVIDYPVNDQIPGIDEIKPIKIPHKIRHHHKKPNDEEQNRIEPVSSTSIWPEFKDKKESFDDEDYFTRKEEEEPPTTTKMDTPTMSSTIDRGMEISAATLVTPITTTTVFEIPSTSTVTAMHESQESRQKLTSIPIEDVSTIANTEIFSSTTSFNESEPFDDTSTVNETEISPREILHEDPLKRNETVLRELLTNLTHLEEVDHGASHQDYGASFLTPVLKSVSYDNNSAPIVFPDIPVNVKIALNIIHLANFDSQQMEYTVDLEMRMSWFDVRLSNNYTKPIRVREKFILDQIWRPDPYFVNSKYSYFHLVSFPNFRMRIKPNGLVTYALR